MAGRAEPVTEAQLQLGSLAWSAFRGPTPEAMALLLEEDLAALPFLAAALERLLAELPAPGDGLTRTERLALRALRARPLTREALFVRQGESETARWLGDLPFYRRLEGLAPLLEATAEGLRLSRLGERVLDGQEDWARLAPPDRWLGGTRLRPQGFWRWDAGRRQLTADAAG
jgi:hypothetical protein